MPMKRYMPRALTRPINYRCRSNRQRVSSVESYRLLAAMEGVRIAFGGAWLLGDVRCWIFGFFVSCENGNILALRP